MTTSQDRTELLRLAASAVALPGHFAEAGVRRAESFAPLARIAQAADKLCFGFDSFEGMAEHTKRDVLPNGDCRWTKGKLHTGGDAGLQFVLQTCRDAGLEQTVRVTRGWVPQCLQCVAAERFAFVHLDLDQHAPTLAAARFFWPRLVPGGRIVCHDVWPGDDRQASGGFHDFAQEIAAKAPGVAPQLHCVDGIPYGWIQKAG